MYLVTTAQQQFWPKSGKIWLLSPGCAPGHAATEAGSQCEIMGVVGNPYQEEKERSGAYAEIRRITEILIPWLASRLNRIHGTDYSDRYWKIQLGFWTLLFVNVAHDRVTRLLKAQSELKGIRIVGMTNCPLTPSDTLNFVSMASGDLFNVQIYSLLCRKLGFPLEEYDWVAGRYSSQENKKRWAVKARRLARTIYRSGYAVLKMLFARRAEVLMVQSYMPRKFELALLAATCGRVVPLHGDFWQDRPSDSLIDKKSRSVFGELPEDCGEVTKLIMGLVETCLPKAFVEDYREVCAFSGRVYKNLLPAVIYSANSWWFDEAFKCWAAKCQERGSKLVGGAHGSAFFVRKDVNTELFEADLADKYLTWGWSEPSLSKLVPTTACKLIDIKPRKARVSGEGIMFCATTHARHNILFLENFSDYLEWQRRFFLHIPGKLRREFLVRLHPEDYGWKMKDKLQEVAPELRFDGLEVDFRKRLDRCRLYVCDHLATTYAEAMTANIPTVMFWDETKYPTRETSLPYVQALKDCNVVHDTPESAAEWITHVYDNPAPWWQSDPCQKAVKDFCFLFARTSETPLKEWKSTFRALLGNYKEIGFKESSIDSVPQPQKTSLDTGLHQSDTVREKLVSGTVEEGRIMSELRSADYKGKVTHTKV